MIVAQINDSLNAVDDEVKHDDAVERNVLTPDFGETANRAIFARSTNDAGSANLPGLSLVFDADGVNSDVGGNNSDGSNTGDRRASPAVGEKDTEKTTEKNEGSSPSTDKVTTTIKVGDVSVPISLSVGQEVTIGRGQNGIPDNNTRVSRNHAVIGRDENGLYVKDLNSTNGTYVFRGGSPTGERVAAEKKVYLADVDAVRFSREGPEIEGGKAAQAKSEKKAAEANDTVVAVVQPDTRRVPPYAGREVPNPDHVQRELTHGKVVGEPKLIAANGEREEYRATIMVDGKPTEVILRNFNNRDAINQTHKEVAAYALNQALGLESPYGPTSIREFEVNGVRKFGSVRLVEQGKNLETELRSMAEKKFGNASDESVKKLIESDPKLKSAMEKAFAERIVLGEKGFQVKDFVITTVNGEYQVRSRNVEGSFESENKPTVELKPGDTLSAQVQSLFSHQAVSEAVRAKLCTFVKQYDTPEGYEQLQRFGLTNKEIDFMLARARELSEKGTFPVPRLEGAPVEEPGKLSDSNKFYLKVTRNLMEAGMELRTKEQVADYLQRVLDHLREKTRETPQSRKAFQDFQTLIDEVKAGNPKAIQAVNKELALNVEPPVAGAGDASLKDLKRATQSPEQRAGDSVAKVLENGAIRGLLVESGITEDRARELEKELISKDKEVQKRAVAEIEKIYAKRGGYGAFYKEARGRLGAVAVVAATIIPQLVESDKK